MSNRKPYFCKEQHHYCITFMVPFINTIYTSCWCVLLLSSYLMLQLTLIPCLQWLLDGNITNNTHTHLPITSQY